MSRDHRKLEAFRLSDALVLDAYHVTRLFPAEERFGLQAQIRRAAVSVATNIVEGSARSSDVEYCRFLEIALGSAREVAYLFSLAKRLGYVSDGNATLVDDGYGAVQGKLHQIIAAVSPRSAGNRRTS
jgi:four helix bundle protein